MSNKSRFGKGKGKRVPKHHSLDKLAFLHKHGAFQPGQVSMVDVAHDGPPAAHTGKFTVRDVAEIITLWPRQE
jgi:hypothetical protein